MGSGTHEVQHACLIHHKCVVFRAFGVHCSRVAW
jgi:hypothetical protein